MNQPLLKNNLVYKEVTKASDTIHNLLLHVRNQGISWVPQSIGIKDGMHILTYIEGKVPNNTPDWIIEILSPSTSYKDENEKLILYEKYGVREYWIIQPGAKIVFMYHLDEKGHYKKPEVAKKDEFISSYSVPEVKIDLKKVFTT